MWQSVWLEASDSLFVSHIGIDADARSSRVRVSTTLNESAAAGDEVIYKIASPDGHTTWESRAHALEPDATSHRTELTTEGNVELWSTDSPSLYRLEASLQRNGKVTDRWSDHFGYRSIETRDGHIVLNGQPIYLRGALDQDYYQQTIYTPPSGDLLREQVLRAKELGLNCLRCHIKVPDPRYLQWADRLGILVWAELPNWKTPTEDARRRGRETMAGLIKRDFNHPSVVIWTIINEGWGMDLPGDEQHRRWLAETFHWVKDIDPTRLVVDNSACAPNFHIKTDLNDFHLYRAIPDQVSEWREWTASWVGAPESTYSSHGDARRRGDEPQILSEFGNWGLPDVNDLRDESGREPWWFDTGRQWGEGIVLPKEVMDRFLDWRMDEVFGSWSTFVAASQEHQFEGLKAEIEDLRSHPEVAGYVITELTDVHWECNGLLDLARNPKAFHHRFTEINAPDVVFTQLEHRRYRPGETLDAEVIVSHYSEHDLNGSTVSWRIDGLGLSGTVGPRDLERATVASYGTIELEIPAAVHAPQSARLEVCLRDPLGRFVNRSSDELLLFPRDSIDIARADVRVARAWDEELARFVGAGGRAVVLVEGETDLPGDGRIALRSREGSKWKGDWAQGMSWLRPEVSAGLGLRPRMSMVFAGLMPDLVITGLTPAVPQDVLAGYYLGWIHDTVALIARVRHGKGAAIICTLPLARSGGKDPLAEALLGRIIALAAAPELPTTSLF